MTWCGFEILSNTLCAIIVVVLRKHMQLREEAGASGFLTVLFLSSTTHPFGLPGILVLDHVLQQRVEATMDVVGRTPRGPSERHTAV